MNTKIVCVLACESQDTLQRAIRLAKAECDLDRVFTEALISFPGGVGERETHLHKASDYFEYINVLADPDRDVPSFKLVFRPRAGAGRFWKDITHQIIRSLEKSGYVASTESLFAEA